MREISYIRERARDQVYQRVSERIYTGAHIEVRHHVDDVIYWHAVEQIWRVVYLPILQNLNQ